MPARPVAKIVVAGAGIAGWFGLNAVMAFYTYLWRNSPDDPDFGAGRIAPMFQQARVFFVLSWERKLAFYGLGLSLALLMAAGVLGVLFFRREFTPKRAVSWFNGGALLAFLAWFGYALWPLPS